MYITHMHSDHIGGLMAEDKLAFPNAIVRADQQDRLRVVFVPATYVPAQ